MLARDGATAYLKLGYHAPAVYEPDFFPMLVLDAVLTGAKGLNLWASFQTPPSQRSARLYRALVRRASRLFGLGCAVADSGAVSVHDFGDRDRGHAARASGGGSAGRD